MIFARPVAVVVIVVSVVVVFLTIQGECHHDVFVASEHLESPAASFDLPHAWLGKGDL